MRVLVVSNLDSARPFGQYTRPFHLSRSLAARGAEVATVGVDCSDVDFGPAWSTGHQSARALARALRTARAGFRPDVVYAHQNMPACVAVGLGLHPLVADVHAIASADWRIFAADAPTRGEAAACRLRGIRAAAMEKVIMRRADRVIAAAAQVADRLVERHALRHAPAVVVNGVDASLLDAPVPPCPEPLAATGPHAMTSLPVASSPANERALALLLEAMPELRRRAPTAQVHVLGTASGPPADGLRYHGLVPSLLPWLHHAEACVLPLPPLSGAYGGVRNKLLDALARGRSVVTTQEGLAGLEEAASWPGVVVAPYDPAGLAAALAGALTDGAATPDGRTAQVQRLRWDVLAGEVEAVLADVAGGARRD